VKKTHKVLKHVAG